MSFPKYTSIENGYSLKTAKQGVVEVTTPLPDGEEHLTLEEWGERASSNDMAVRKSITTILRHSLGYPPGTYVLWSKPEQATVIYLHQLVGGESSDEEEEVEEKAPPKSTKKGTKTGTKKGASSAKKTSKASEPAEPSQELNQVLDVLEDVRAIAEENRELQQELHAKVATVNILLQLLLQTQDMLDDAAEIKDALGLEEMAFEESEGN